MRRIFMRRAPGTFNWIMDEPELLDYAVNIANLWLEREQKEKGYVTANHLNKACGILSEEIFHCTLCECGKPHVRTVPLLDKKHPVNARKPYDIKMDEYTFDIKAISPLPPPTGHHCNLNVNKAEIDANGKCDFYVGSKCYPELQYEFKPRENMRVAMEWARGILDKVNIVAFIGYAEAAEIISPEQLVHTRKPFYSLHPPFRTMEEFAKRFNIDIKLGAQRNFIANLAEFATHKQQ